jgi:asparagine synthase (glutamine-hydrolysing)
MCGILGVLPPVDLELFQNSLRSLAHRGPDGEGVWRDDEYILLGHRRLSILDISTSALQPMSYLDRYHCVFNGEIYNFIEVRKELESQGHCFRTNSDTEVLIAAYCQWGPQGLNRLNGMWALAIWDSYEKKLFLSRDRMGKKPLFYIYDGYQFAFASEQKALLRLLKEVNPSKDFHLLCENSYSYEGSENCLFEGIKRFPAAHYGYYYDGKLSKVCYWSVLEQREPVTNNYHEQVEYMRELLIDSCRLRLRSDVLVGTGLSGGVDSSFVAASISEVFKNRSLERCSSNSQTAFVASFPNTIMDESEPARKIASHLDIRLNEIIINPSECVQHIEDWAYLFEEVHEVNWMPHISLYKEMRRNGIKVSIDGHGGDELFCGYETSVLHALTAAFPNPIKMKMILDTYRNIHPDNEHFQGMKPWHIFRFFLRSSLSSLMQGKEYNGSLRKPSSKFDSLGNHLFDLSFNSVLPTLLRNYDRYSMISGVELRMPLLDYRIVEFAFSLPWSSKVRNGFSKSILRDAASTLLPSDIIYNKKKLGFAPPIVDWIRGPLREYLLDQVHSAAFQQANLIQPSLLAASLKKIIFGSDPIILYKAEEVWKQFTIYLWEKTFLQKQPWK